MRGGGDCSAVVTSGRAVLQVILTNPNKTTTTGTLCVLNDGSKYGNGPGNATLAAYFETDVKFQVIGNKSVHLYGQLIDARTDAPMGSLNEDVADDKPMQQIKNVAGNMSSPSAGVNGNKRNRNDSNESSSSSSGSNSGSSSSDSDEDDEEEEQTQQRRKRQKVNNEKPEKLDAVSGALVDIIKTSPRKVVNLNELGTLYKKATNRNLKKVTGTRLTKYLEQNAGIFKYSERDQTVTIKNEHLYF